MAFLSISEQTAILRLNSISGVFALMVKLCEVGAGLLDVIYRVRLKDLPHFEEV
jgi:hypothetical protein